MTTRTPDWMDRALCAETDPESFFPDRGGSTKVAKAMCARCDVTAACLEFAITSEITYGVWGGQPERTIRKLRSERRALKRAATTDSLGAASPSPVAAAPGDSNTAAA